MTPAEFITKWRASELKERSAAKGHFIYLCRAGVDSPQVGIWAMPDNASASEMKDFVRSMVLDDDPV